VLLARAPRELAALELVAEASRWEEPARAGRARGFALHACFGAVVAMVAEVALDPDGRPQVERVFCAVDCGRVVNPAHVVAQIESGIAFGLSAALYGQITFERGRVEQLNFGDYAILRGSRMPAVDVRLVPSDAAPAGVGEIGVPPIAPAVCNALYALSGKRIRKLPIRAADLRSTGTQRA
jgi:CO/xanthine dehydrogenase Mo-binding subunit